MNCFNHSGAPSVGICKTCSKGLCADCATDLGHGLACKGVHEADVSELHSIIQRSVESRRSNSKRGKYYAPAFYAFMGAVFAFDGWTRQTGAFNFGLVMGGGFLAYSLIVLSANLRVFRK